MPQSKKEVLLITMPWGSLYYPSLRIGLLKSILHQNQIPVHVEYLNLAFYNFISKHQTHLSKNLRFTLADYDKITHDRYGQQLGEWLFTHTLYDSPPASEKIYFDLLTKAGASKVLLKKISKIRDLIPSFLKWCIKNIPFHQYTVILFTSMLVQDPCNQNISSLALSKLIKYSFPNCRIIFEGAHCQGSMGAALGKNFPWIDAVLCGESEGVLPEIVSAFLKQKTIPAFPNVWSGINSITSSENWNLVNLNKLPVPDYDDYFSALEKTKLSRKFSPALLVETSRGCWWGMKSLCTFCGLNGPVVKFRSKTPEIFLNELQELVSRCKILEIKTTDNILDMHFFDTFFPKLKQMNLSLQIFFEIKVNLKKEQIRALKEAGIHWIQGGIESLSSKHLALMRKGCTTIQNIQFLKWCMEYGIIVMWNLLYAVPGEKPEDYADIEKIIPLLTHLTPPVYLMPISINRFSPYFINPEKFGIRQIKPKKIYEWIYPQKGKDLYNLAYSFDCENNLSPDTYLSSLRDKILFWQSHAGVNLLTYHLGTDFIKIQDRRPGLTPKDIIMDRMQSKIYLRCDQAKTVKEILTEIKREENNFDLEADSIGRFLKDMTKEGIMFEEKGKYLSLALPYNHDYSFHRFVRGIGSF